jgi:hypothetical protein
MADSREQFSFSVGDFGITSTEEMQAVDSFLNSDPEDIKVIPPKENKPEESKDQPQNKKAVKKQPVVKTEEDEEEKKEEPSRELLDVSLYDALEEKGEEEDEEEDAKSETPAGAEVATAEGGEENMFNTIAQELVNHGIFNLDDEEEGIEISSPEELLGRFQYEARKQASVVIDKFLNRFGDNYRDMFENVFVRGINPVDYLNRYTKVEGIQALDLADEGNQERIVRELYRSEGRSAEYIEKRVTQLKNYNDLLDEATEAQKILVTKEQQQIDEAATKKQEEINRRSQIKNEYVNNVGRILSDKLKTKDFDGIPVDKRFAENIFGYMTQDRFQTPDGELLTTFDKDILDLKRPENHETKVKVAMLLQMIKEDPQLTKLAKKAVSKESNKLFEGLKKTAMKTGKKESQEEPKVKSWFSQ